MKICRKTAALIWNVLEKNGKAGKLTSQADLSRLNPGADIRKAEKERGIEMIGYLILIVAGTVFLSLAALLSERDLIADGGRVRRPEAGEGRQMIETVVTRTGTGETYPVSIGIDEVKLTGDEMDHLFEEAFDYLERAVLGDNDSPDHVSQDLKFVTEVPGTVMKAEWEDYGSEFFYSDGRLRNEKLTEPAVCELMVKLTYFDEERYRRFAICVCPPETEEDFAGAAAREAELRNAEEPSKRDIILPEKVEGEAVTWTDRNSSKAAAIAVLGILAAGALIPAMNADLKKKIKKRDEELLRDYPDIVSKLTLLLSAGMTVRGAFERIVTDEPTFAYREMKITLNEIKMGNSEAGAYERFGSRIGLLPYRRLGTILSRNLRRGNRDILPLLDLEAKEAFAMRKEQVRKKGEEAGTKLLIPMVGMMCIVIAVVVVPAFASFG